MRFWIIVDLNFIAVLGDKRVQRFDQMPRRTIHHRLERGVNVFGRSASPFFTARYEFQLNHAFRSEVHCHNPIQILRRRRHEHAVTFLQRGQHFRPPNELWNVRRTDLLFAFGHQHQVYRHLFPCAANGMQRREERCFRSFLIYRTTTDNHFSQR